MVKWWSSKSLSWVRFPLTLMIVSLLLVFSSIFLILHVFKFFFFKKLFLLSLAILTMYWLVSIFIYLYNSSRAGRFTTAINRFWRRSFMLFWIIEGFLFLIYIYLVLNCAIETEWLAEQTQLFQNLDFIQKEWFYDILLTYLVLTTNYIILKNFLKKNTLFIKILILVQYVVALIIFWGEFLQFFYFTQIFSFNTAVLDKGNSWEMNWLPWPTLVNQQYWFLMIFLKFWHAMFIFLVHFVTLRIIRYSNYKDTSVLRISNQNFFFFFIFNLLVLFMVYKYWMNYRYSFAYYWFFVNNSEYSSLFENTIYIFKSFF